MDMYRYGVEWPWMIHNKQPFATIEVFVCSFWYATVRTCSCVFALFSPCAAGDCTKNRRGAVLAVCRSAIFHFKDAFPHFIAECCRSALCGFSPFDQRRTGGRQVSKVRRRSLAPCAARSQLLRCLTRQKPKCSTRFVCIQYWSAYNSGAAPSSLCILYIGSASKAAAATFNIKMLCELNWNRLWEQRGIWSRKSCGFWYGKSMFGYFNFLVDRNDELDMYLFWGSWCMTIRRFAEIKWVRNKLMLSGGIRSSQIMNLNMIAIWCPIKYSLISCDGVFWNEMNSPT
jgi:hypothetical protein